MPRKRQISQEQVEAVVLDFLRKTGGAITYAGIAAATGMKPVYVSDAMFTLMRRGWVVRVGFCSYHVIEDPKERRRRSPDAEDERRQYDHHLLCGCDLVRLDAELRRRGLSVADRLVAVILLSSAFLDVDDRWVSNYQSDDPELAGAVSRLNAAGLATPLVCGVDMTDLRRIV